MLERLARTCYRRRGRVLITWVVASLAIFIVANAVIKADYRADMNLPNSESRDVLELLEAANPNRAGFDGQIVFEAEQGIDDPAVQAAMEDLFAKVDALDGVDVTSPYDAPGQISDRAPIAFASLAISDRQYSEAKDLGTQIEELGDKVHVDGVTIEYGGDIFSTFELPASEALGLLAAVIILIVAFGSVVAMGLPIGTAVLGLLAGVGFTVMLSRVQAMPEFAPQMTAMIGLGVGIDYALFIVTRYREGLHDGLDPEVATVHAVDTSGRAVLFAGATVIISLLGLYIMGLSFVRGLATGAALGVVTMMIAAVTLLPALIGFAGHRIEVTTWRGLIGVLVVTVGFLAAILFGIPAFALVGLLALAFVIVGSLTFLKQFNRRVPRRREKPREQQYWYRWSRVVQHRPWIAFAAGLTVLLLLAVPLFSLHMGFSDNGNLNKDQTPRRAYDMLSEGFGPGFNGQIIVTVQGDILHDQTELGRFVNTLGNDDGVAKVVGPIPLNDDLAIVQVYAKSAPQDQATTRLINHLRADVIPVTGADAKVGGFNAMSIDFSSYLANRLPWLIGAVLLLSFLLLMVVFRSVLVPLKAVVMNLLSIGAAYGLIVAVFQWGWAAGLIGVDRKGPIEPWAPMMLFAITFGLSMDYEVFLLSRMKEQYDLTRDNATAVADGLVSTARVITAAAAIMVCVFSAFVLGDDRSLKLFGLGLAAAVFIDATIVRMVLVPATMELLGDRNWWMPHWLGRILPRVHIEGKHAPVPDVPPDWTEDELVGARD